MSEKEIIERINDLIETCNIGIKKHGAYDDLFNLDKQALEGILDLYNKEKEISHYLQSQLDVANAYIIHLKIAKEEAEKLLEYSISPVAIKELISTLDSEIKKLEEKYKELDGTFANVVQREIAEKVYAKNILNKLL